MQFGVLVAYYLTLFVYLIASYFPEYRLWGFNWWSYYPDWVRWTLFVIAGLCPAILKFADIPEFVKTDDATDSGSRERWFLFYTGAAAVFFGGLYSLLRGRIHFSGDGYTLLSSLATDNPLAMKSREYGESLAHIWLKALIGGDSESAALLSYQIISILAGLLFVVTVALFARLLYKRPADRVLFHLAVCSGGYTLLFFGYVENYALFILTALIFTLTGLLVAEKKINRHWLLPPLIGAIFFHVLGVTLIPSALYLWIAPTRFGRTVRNWKISARILAGLPLLVITAVIFHHFYTTNYFFQFAFIPLFDNRFTVEGYTLFSWKHLLDYLNLLFLLIPGLLVMTVSLLRLPVRKLSSKRPYFFLMVLAVSTLGAVFIFDPKLGMPRDWDLFAFAGIPTLVLLVKLVNDPEARVNGRTPSVILAVILAFTILIPRSVANIDEYIGLNRVHLRQSWDHAKSRQVQSVLEHYVDLTGSGFADSLIETDWKGQYEQISLHDSALALMNQQKQLVAMQLLHRSCRIDPFYWNAWTTLGLCFLQSGKFTEAEEALRIALGLNPHSAGAYNNLGAVFTAKGNPAVAEEMYRRSIEIVDSGNPAPFVGLTHLYKVSNQPYKYRELLFYTTENFDAPGPMYQERADLLLADRQFPAAAEAYREAMKKGLDSSYVRQVIEPYPVMKELLELK